MNLFQDQPILAGLAIIAFIMLIVMVSITFWPRKH